MFTLGNELGRNPAMYELVARFKSAIRGTSMPKGQITCTGSRVMPQGRLLGDGQDRKEPAGARRVFPW